MNGADVGGLILGSYLGFMTLAVILYFVIEIPKTHERKEKERESTKKKEARADRGPIDPCPFCGGDGALAGIGTRIAIKCARCGARSGSYVDFRDAIYDWNHGKHFICTRRETNDKA